MQNREFENNIKTESDEEAFVIEEEMQSSRLSDQARP